MPQDKHPPRLAKRRDRKGDVEYVYWIIRDGERRISTGCLESDAAGAERALAAYIAEKYEPVKGGKASAITVADVLIVYMRDKADSTARPVETKQMIGRLNAFFGSKTVSDVKGDTCREYADARGGGARRELEVLRAAIRYYHKEHGLDVVPMLTLPPKSLPRERYLTRSEVAAMLWAAIGYETVKGADEKPLQPLRWKRQRNRNLRREHIARLILIGVYTGTRPGAILALQWAPNEEGGHVDFMRGVIHRRAKGERVAHNKRKTPVKIPRRLMTFLRLWRKADQGLRHVVHYEGERVTKINKAFRSIRAECGLGEDVVPHILRHTRGTWLAEAGVPSGEAAASLGMTVEEYERTYLHNDPKFQKTAADAY